MGLSRYIRSNGLTSTGISSTCFWMLYFLLILLDSFWNSIIDPSSGLYPTISVSNIQFSASTCSSAFSTTSGNCLVTFSNLLVNTLTSPSFICICALMPSYLLSMTAGLPTSSNPSSIVSTFLASIEFTGRKSSNFNSSTASMFFVHAWATSVKSLVKSYAFCIFSLCSPSKNASANASLIVPSPIPILR